jgi:predicted RNA-binding protein YlqC (UPF0109 family)
MEAAKLIETIVREMVDRPEDVRVDVLAGRSCTILQLSVHPSEIGRVIGKQGYHAKALRVLLGCIGAKERHSYNLEIIEP